MARLHEYQGKAVLAQAGLPIPRGEVVRSPEEAAAAARKLGGPCVVKIQAWTTGRAALGGVAFADTPEQATEHARTMLTIKVGNFPVTELLVEEKLSIARELFVSLSIDDRERRPTLLIAADGGSGIEERARNVHRISCDLMTGPAPEEIERSLAMSRLDRRELDAARSAIVVIFRAAKAIDARSLEVNPLVMTQDGRVVAADCRLTVDDYAVFRHPELGIEIAREIDHP